MKTRSPQGPATVAIVAAILAACGGSGNAFRSAAETIARQTGRDAPEIENAFRIAMKGSTEDELAAAAAKAAERNGWVETLGSRLALGTERQRTLRAITGATCDIIGLLEDLGEAATPAQARQAVIENIRAQQLPESEAKISEIVDGIVAQANALESSGSIDLQQASIDLACVLYS
jgi:hypothetical protein